MKIAKFIPASMVSLLVALAVAPGMACAEEAGAVVESAASAETASTEAAAEVAMAAITDAEVADVAVASVGGTVAAAQPETEEAEEAEAAANEEAQTEEIAAEEAAKEASEAAAPEAAEAAPATKNEIAAAAAAEAAQAKEAAQEQAMQEQAMQEQTAKAEPETASKKTTSDPVVLSTQANDRTEAAGYYFADNSVWRISTALTSKDTMVLDVSGGSAKSGANVQLYKANNTLAQYWRAEYQGNGIYRFVSYTGGHLLGATGTSSKSNVRVQDSGTINWKAVKNSNGTYSLLPANATNLRLDVSGGSKKNSTNIWVYSKNGTAAQNFYFTLQQGLTEAYEVGKTVDADMVEIALAENEDLRVDVAGSSRNSGANVQLEADSKAFSQKFQITYIGNGLYEFQDANSGKVLDVSGASKTAGANIQQWNRNKTVAQYWYLQPSGSGYQIKSAASGLAMGLNGNKQAAKTNVQTAKPSNASSQVFTLKNTQLVDNGTYVIQSSLVAAMVLDVKGGSTASKANLQLYRSNGTDAQKFTITHLGGGIYSIVNAKSGMYMDVSGGSKKSGANVWQYSGNNTNAQKWRIEVGADGLMFKSVASGNYLDVSGGSVKFGTNVQQWKGNETKAQCWVLHEEDWKFYPNGTNLNDMKIITKAEQYQGMPYQWGGRSPSTSFDCAGLVMYCSNAVWGTNFDLVYTNAERLYDMCQHISASEAKVGDLVFYRGTYGSNVNYISHVVLYAGRGVMYGAGDPIGYANVNSIKNIRKQPAAILYARIRH